MDIQTKPTHTLAEHPEGRRRTESQEVPAIEHCRLCALAFARSSSFEILCHQLLCTV